MSGAPDNPIGVGPQPGSVRPRRYLFGATLTLVALVTMLAVVVVYAGVPDRLLKQGDGHGSLTRTISVVVAAREIPRGQRIFPLMVRTSAIRGTDLPPHAFRKPIDVWGARATVPILQNEIITNDLLAVDCPRSAFSCPVPSDLVAKTMPIDVQRPTRSIAAGDYVDVIATVTTAVFSKVHPRLVSLTVFTSVAVIRMSPPPTVHAGPRSISILVSQCDAMYLDWFAVNASLRYTVVSPDYSAEIASADSRCADPIRPARVDARWGFSTANPSRPG